MGNSRFPNQQVIRTKRPGTATVRNGYRTHASSRSRAPAACWHLAYKIRVNSHPCGDPNAPVDLMACNDIQPPIPPLFHRLKQGSGVIIGCTLVASALLLLLTLHLRAVRKVALPFVVAGAFAAFSCGIAFLSPNFADWITDYGDGEPFALQGASIWPTILLRALGIVVSVSLIWQGLRQVDNNLIEVARDLRLPPPDEVTDPMANDESRSWRKKLESKFSYSFAKAQPEDNDRYKLELAWNDYVYRGRSIARSSRVLVLVGAMIIIWMLLCAIFGWPRFPARNETIQPIYFSIQKIYFWITLFNLVSLQLLIFFVLDTTLLCLSLVSQLAKQQTQWHQNTRTYYGDRLGLKRFQSDVQINSVIDDWIDLTFMERRTRCINQFIFYPFIVITLLLVSRSTLFANYPPDAPTLITTGVSLIIAFGLALWLPHAAEKARDFAKRDITAAIVRTKGFEDGRLAGQLEALLNRVNSLQGGAFRPFTQQPAVRALLLPLSVLGGNALVDFLALPGA